jgi:hypothetical protein
MRGCCLVRAVLIVLSMLLEFADAHAPQPKQPVVTSVCALMRDPATFAGRIVKLRATVQSTMETITIVDPNDPACGNPWLDSAKERGQSDFGPDSYDKELQRRHPVFLINDQYMKQFDGALSAILYPRDNKVMHMVSMKRYTVTATMTGRVDFSGKKGLGFGHLNGWHVRFVLSSVDDVDAKELPYDPAMFSREPGRSSP